MNARQDCDSVFDKEMRPKLASWRQLQRLLDSRPAGNKVASLNLDQTRFFVLPKHISVIF